MNFRKKIKFKNSGIKQKKEDVLENLYALFEGNEKVLNVFDSKIFPIKIENTGVSDKVCDHSNHKILTPHKCFKDYQ